jgi:chromosomal replication initiation ATPase DnaA
MSKIDHKEILREIGEIEKALGEKYGCHIRLTVSLRKKGLEELVEVVNKVFQMVKPFYFEVNTNNLGIRKKDRNAYLVIFRGIYYKLARECGHTLEDTGVAIGVDHATVLHGMRKINKLLEEEDIKSTSYFALVQKELGVLNLPS